jgi:hypothetical protein
MKKLIVLTMSALTIMPISGVDRELDMISEIRVEHIILKNNSRMDMFVHTDSDTTWQKIAPRKDISLYLPATDKIWMQTQAKINGENMSTVPFSINLFASDYQGAKAFEIIATGDLKSGTLNIQLKPIRRGAVMN